MSRRKNKEDKESLDDARQELAEAEYINRFLLSCSFIEAEDAYRRAIGKLNVEIPEKIERNAIDRRRNMLKLLEPEILSVKRKEYKELEVLHLQLRRLILQDDTAETGIPDEIKLDQLRDMDSEAVTNVINGFKKLQEMRRDILSS